MNLEEWRRQREHGEDLTLPSGLVVQVRQVSLLDLAGSGQIPQTLRPKIDELIGSSGKASKTTLDQLGKFADVLDLVCERCLRGPVGLTTDELPYGDKIVIFNWANEMSGKLQPFRGEQAESMGA